MSGSSPVVDQPWWEPPPTSCATGAAGLLVPPADAAAVASAVARHPTGPEMAARHDATARITAEASRLDVVCRQWADRLYDVVDRHARDARGMEGRRDVVL
jgi:hypothetical protein